MIGLIFTILAAQSANVFDQFDQKPAPFAGPARLVITWHQAGISTVEYPTQARCEIARSFVEAEVRRRTQANLAALPPGSVTIGTPANGAFCIPG